MKTILTLVLLAAICIGGYFLFRNYQRDKTMTDGSYSCVGCLSPERAAAYDRFDHGQGPDPDPRPSAHKEDAGRDATAQPAETVHPAGGTQGQTAYDQQANQYPSTASRDAASHASRMPDTTPASAPLPNYDTAPANAQNGVRFSGSGAYQWYREGDITWRLNTQTGSSCIIYATLEEWRKRVVLDHACGSSL